MLPPFVMVFEENILNFWEIPSKTTSWGMKASRRSSRMYSWTSWGQRLICRIVIRSVPKLHYNLTCFCKWLNLSASSESGGSKISQNKSFLDNIVICCAQYLSKLYNLCSIVLLVYSNSFFWSFMTSFTPNRAESCSNQERSVNNKYQNQNKISKLENVTRWKYWASLHGGDYWHIPSSNLETESIFLMCF